MKKNKVISSEDFFLNNSIFFMENIENITFPTPTPTIIPTQSEKNANYKAYFSQYLPKNSKNNHSTISKKMTKKKNYTINIFLSNSDLKKFKYYKKQGIHHKKIIDNALNFFKNNPFLLDKSNIKKKAIKIKISNQKINNIIKLLNLKTNEKIDTILSQIIRTGIHEQSS